MAPPVTQRQQNTGATAESPQLGASDRAASSARSASLVGAGIFLSRISGLIREIVLRALFGSTPVADAYGAALQLPKVLQNLLGEGSLSAAFVPVYAETLEDGTPEEAAKLRGAVLGLLATAVTALTLLIVVLAPWLAKLVLWGFADGTKLDLTIRLTRVMAVGIGFIVLAAWCLGVLNAHRKFFLSYVTPVAWNLAIIIALLFGSITDRVDGDLAQLGAIGVAVGGLLQLLIQLPAVIKVAGAIRPSLAMAPPVRTVLRRFVPAVAGRGVVTLSTYVDLALASLLASGAIALIGSAQTLYLLPISVFAMGVAAADLPELAREQSALPLARQRIAVGTERILFFLTFSAIAYLTVGRLLVAALFQWVNFDQDDTITIWLILGGYALGLAPAGLSRLLQNASYAVGDVKGPARIALYRVILAVVVGVLLMFSLDRIGVDGGQLVDGGDLPAFSPVDSRLREGTDFNRLGAVGLALGGSVAAWLEYALLRRRLLSSFGQLPVWPAVRPLLPGALAAFGVGGICALILTPLPSLVAAPLALVASGLVYVLAARDQGAPTARQLTRLVAGRLRSSA